MAYDKAPTRDGAILAMGVLTSVTLIALVPIFHSYFNYMADRELEAKVGEAPRVDLGHYREDQQRVLSSAPVSVEEAMSQIAQRGRGAAPTVAPRRSGRADVDAVEGWNQLPNAAAAQAAQRAWQQAEDERQARLAAQQQAAVDGGVAPAPEAPAPQAPAPQGNP